ncbi:arylsulfatase regulator Fe-S oxidoreductase [Vulcanisaeta distributa DSM 14429]|uniref:Arylsulfatase regulator Fe-S oxidoreductase n=1 Tax=Vulcanisaeta distributa (strain DSM 14429 / JCM 11212 / NBRC 100878 / IC-017) TaxID=572478 RepID=E1QQC5_VULDI|nr:arylsulfatase regulator Fe-S oxidoreductase [Vulcanisaeta distributa DSM 14429]
MPNGTLNKCTIKLYEDIDRIDRLNNDGTLMINKDKLLWWVKYHK